MKSNLKWRSILLLGLALLLASLVVGCSDIDSEAYEYLSRMQMWQEKWDDTGYHELDECEHLLDELRAIEPPQGMVIPLKLDGRIVRTLTASDHEEYVSTHRDYILASRHMETMQELEEERFKARGLEVDPCPICPTSPEAAKVCEDLLSLEYQQACTVEYRSIERLGRTHGRWLWYFVHYFPER